MNGLINMIVNLLFHISTKPVKANICIKTSGRTSQYAGKSKRIEALSLLKK
jgi:hypothetical protein